MKKGDLKSGPILSFQQWLNLKLNHRPRHLDSEDVEKMLVLGKLVIPTSRIVPTVYGNFDDSGPSASSAFS